MQNPKSRNSYIISLEILFCKLEKPDKINVMTRKKLFFWIFIGILLIFDGGLLIYQTIIKKSQADIIPKYRKPSSLELLPDAGQTVLSSAPKIQFSEEQSIYTFAGDYIYKFPILIKHDTDNLLFLIRGKSSQRLNEIIYLRSTDLVNWTNPEKIWTSKYQTITDLEGQKTSIGYLLFYAVKENDKNSFHYLFSKDGQSWEDTNLPTGSEEYIRVSLLEDKGNLRLFLLSKDQKTLKQMVSSNGKGWTNPKEAIKLSLKIDDLALFKKQEFYVLLFSLNNELYYTESLDLHSFQKSQDLFALADNSFSFASNLIYATSDEVYLKSLIE